MHTPNTVMPVSFTSMAQVPTNTLMTRQHTDTVGGRTSSVRQTSTLLKKVTEKGQVSIVIAGLCHRGLRAGDR